MDTTEKVYCPVCAKHGKNKLLFKKKPDAAGKIVVWCRQCKAEVEIELGNEPLSRE